MRASEKEGKLRGCPTCGTKVTDAHIGMRDFGWVNEVLPGRLGLMDIDGTLTQASTGRVLMLELKPKGAPISMGARLTFALFVKAGFDVWYVWDQADPTRYQRVKVAVANIDGSPGTIRELTKSRLANLVKGWWEDGLAE